MQSWTQEATLTHFGWAVYWDLRENPLATAAHIKAREGNALMSLFTRRAPYVGGAFFPLRACVWV